MAKTLRNVLLFIGFAFVIHGGISAAQHRSFVRLTQQELHSLPIDITVQTIFGLFLASWGVLLAAGEFKNIQVNAETKSKSFETVGNRPSFYIFEHRGKVLHGDAKGRD
ncbi:ER membrane protein complex subunit 5-like [Styela clava]|uniref:membrane magnesium transporter 1-like n=1 Tax=Styela clava TaxID=7725 RepID=UPI00193A5245|nr:membrane magnesium transporter 1-like [Styela clava]